LVFNSNESTHSSTTTQEATGMTPALKKLTDHIGVEVTGGDASKAIDAETAVKLRGSKLPSKGAVLHLLARPEDNLPARR